MEENRIKESWEDIFNESIAEVTNHPIKYIKFFIEIILIDVGCITIGKFIGESVGFRRTGSFIGSLIGCYYSIKINKHKI